MSVWDEADPFDEYLCKKGHYTSVPYSAPQMHRCRCGAAWAFANHRVTACAGRNKIGLDDHGLIWTPKRSRWQRAK